MDNPGHFLLYFRSFQTIYIIKTVDFGGVQTRIDGVERKHTWPPPLPIFTLFLLSLFIFPSLSVCLFSLSPLHRFLYLQYSHRSFSSSPRVQLILATLFNIISAPVSSNKNQSDLAHELFSSFKMDDCLALDDRDYIFINNRSAWINSVTRLGYF